MCIYNLSTCILVSLLINSAAAQTKPNPNVPGNGGFIQFTSDGKDYSMNQSNNAAIKINTELKYAGSTPQLLAAIYSNTTSRDTIVIYAYDDKGLTTANATMFSKNAKLIFVYKLYGKGTIIKSLDNAKGEINSSDYVKFTKLENKPGGTIEGQFNFTDIPFKDLTGKVTARLKGISNGSFRTAITQYNEILKREPEVSAEGLSEVARLLFKDVKCKLPDFEKNQIADSTGFVLSGNKEEPFAMDKESLDYPYNAQVTITDMNKDGIEEVFIQFGNSYTSGMTGSSIVLFIKSKQGVYRTNLGFPGVEPEQLKTGYGGYPDLLIGGPGFEFPIWRWNGKEYVFYKTQKQ